MAILRSLGFLSPRQLLPRFGPGRRARARLLPKPDAAVPRNGATVPRNAAAVPRNDATVPRNDAAVPKNDAAVLSPGRPPKLSRFEAIQPHFTRRERVFTVNANPERR